MIKIKLLFSIVIFSFLLIITSIIKNEAREIEKNIYHLSELIIQKEKDLNESELDFSYLTSPSMIEKSLENLDNENYFAMELSKIFLSLSHFKNIQNKLVTQKKKNEKKIK